MADDRNSRRSFRVALVALAGLWFGAIGSNASPGKLTPSRMMDGPCCRVPIGQACCCCEAKAAPTPGLASSSSATSTVGVEAAPWWPVGSESVGLPAPCRCLASEPAVPGPESTTLDDRGGRPAPADVPAFDDLASGDLDRIRRAPAPGSRSVSRPPSPSSLRTTPLLI